MSFDYLLQPNYYFSDQDIDFFLNMIIHSSEYSPQSTLLIQIPSMIKPIEYSKKHLQILYHSFGRKCVKSPDLNVISHYIGIFYESGMVHIYDSLNLKTLHQEVSLYLNKLFPFEFSIFYHTVQQQTNGVDCGPFSIAFLTSLILGIIYIDFH